MKLNCNLYGFSTNCSLFHFHSYFPIYEVVKEKIEKGEQEPTNFWVGPVVAGIVMIFFLTISISFLMFISISFVTIGLVSRTITGTVVSPLELVRTNLQANAVADASIESNNMIKTLVNIVNRHGWTQLWGGLGPTLLRDVPFSSAYWSGFEYLKYKLNRRYNCE